MLPTGSWRGAPPALPGSSHAPGARWYSKGNKTSSEHRSHPSLCMCKMWLRGNGTQHTWLGSHCHRAACIQSRGLSNTRPPPGVGRTGRTCRFPGPTQACSQILMPWPMGRPLTTAPVTCHQTEAGLWHCHAPVQAPGQQKCPAPTRGSAVLSGVQGMRGCGISPVGHGGHNTGSQNAELALISPRKVSGPNLSDLYHVEGGGLVCRIRGPFTQDPSIGKALKHTYFILLGVHSNVKPGWHLEDLCVCGGGISFNKQKRQIDFLLD